MYEIVYTKQALKDKEKLTKVKLSHHAKKLIDIIEKNPYQYPPNFEKLSGDLKGAFSRRINQQHRLVYQVYERVCVVKVLRMWTHYE